MRFYISGAITGIDDYKERFEAAESTLKRKGHEVVNPAALVVPEGVALDYEAWMDVDVAYLKHCDGIYMLSGWESSKGANREYGYALGSGKAIRFEAAGHIGG